MNDLIDDFSIQVGNIFMHIQAKTSTRDRFRGAAVLTDKECASLAACKLAPTIASVATCQLSE